jgi:hypothetical protein
VRNVNTLLLRHSDYNRIHLFADVVSALEALGPYPHAKASAAWFLPAFSTHADRTDPLVPTPSESFRLSEH